MQHSLRRLRAGMCAPGCMPVRPHLCTADRAAPMDVRPCRLQVCLWSVQHKGLHRLLLLGQWRHQQSVQSGRQGLHGKRVYGAEQHGSKVCVHTFELLHRCSVVRARLAAAVLHYWRAPVANRAPVLLPTLLRSPATAALRCAAPPAPASRLGKAACPCASARNVAQCLWTVRRARWKAAHAATSAALSTPTSPPPSLWLESTQPARGGPAWTPSNSTILGFLASRADALPASH